MMPAACEGVRPLGSRDKGDTAQIAVVLLVIASSSSLIRTMPQIRRAELRRRRVRRKKLTALRYRYENAEDEAEKAGLLRKLVNIAPWLAFEFREQAKLAAPPAEEIGRRKKKAKQTRGAGESAGPRAEEDDSERE
jgi:Family of unknown function (DUF6800)